MLCTHIWRCVLLLLFRAEYAAALVCVQASATIGDARSVNAACGRYIAFFLKLILDRLRREEPAGLEQDEEMMAYVSGDMQSTADGSWIWQGSETGSQLKTVSPQMSNVPSFQDSITHQAGPSRCSFSEEPELEWEGWDWVERTVQYLLDEQQQQRQRGYDRRDVQAPTRTTEPPKPDPSLLSPDPAGGNSNTTSQRSPSNSRMTIANII